VAHAVAVFGDEHKAAHWLSTPLPLLEDRSPSDLLIYARLDGEGERKVGGRWNSPGRAVVYMAQSVALAVLENLVPMSRRDYPTGYVIVEARVPDHIPILEYDRFLVCCLG